MNNNPNNDGILTERDLVKAWLVLLNERKANYVEVNLDELNYQLMYETRMHYSKQMMRYPLRQMLENFNQTKWQWLRLNKKVINARKTQEKAKKQR